MRNLTEIMQFFTEHKGSECMVRIASHRYSYEDEKGHWYCTMSMSQDNDSITSSAHGHTYSEAIVAAWEKFDRMMSKGAPAEWKGAVLEYKPAQPENEYLNPGD